MEQIQETIKSVIAGWEAHKKHKEGRDPEAALKKILTKKEWQHIKFNYFRHDICCVHVDSSAWLYHLNLKKTELLDKLRQALGAVKDIRFYLGRIR